VRQKIFHNVEELLKRLNTERRLISEMFYNRKKLEFRYEDTRDFVESEKNLQLLIDYGVIRQEGELLELEDAYLRFLEEVLQVNEDISTAMVEDSVARLRESIDFYLSEHNNPEEQHRYLRKVKRSLRTIAMMAERNVIDLKRNVNDTYKNQRNYAIKRSQLEKYLEQIASISRLVKETERLLDDEHATFNNFAPDEQLVYIIIDVRTQLKAAFHSLIDLEKTIRDYLHQIDAIGKLVKKIRLLKYHKDQLTWQTSTNIRELTESMNPIIFENRSNYQLKPSLTMLSNSGDGLSILSEAQQLIARRKKQRYEPEPPLTQADLEMGTVIENFVNVDDLAAAFMASGQDLFNFVLSFRYESEQTLEQKVEYYTEIILNHFDQLTFSTEWNEWGDISYPIVYPKNRI
jgi:hypothetical protein